MSWRGTLLLVILAGLAAATLLLSGRSRTRSPQEPLLGIDPAQADRIVIQDSGSEIILVKQNGIWNLQSAPADRADPGMIRNLLESAAGITPLNTLKPADLTGPVSLESLNLNNPKRSLTIRDGKDRRLNVGIEGAAAGQLYARLGSDKTVYLIPSETVRLAFRPAEDFRDPRLTTLSADHLSEVTFSKGDTLQQLLLRKDTRGSEWNLLSPLKATGDQRAISTWIASLLSARIDRWMPAGTDPAACGLDFPTAVFTAREAGGSAPVTVSIGSEVPGSPQSRYVRCSDRPGICILSGIGTALEVTPQKLRSRQLPHVEYDAVDRIEIRPREDGSAPSPLFLLSRKKGTDDWNISPELSEGGGGTLPGVLVREWFEKLQGVAAESFEPATSERLEARGLGRPAVIRLIAHLSENTAEEGPGDMVLAEYAFGTPSEGKAALRENNAPDLMIVPESTLELAKREALAP